ncbi:MULTISPECIES: S8 family peptidase [unclassified Nodularia (in: cyanobacteria)]|uniref:S8 family peptidase n=1 Tax=unclassified Nodularia (in: cyanobacteria) TaxID=2656917 RepID=UPI0018819530|nr:MULTISPECIES: S8 family peptidase [unclassified Nodularia (in: cyanobacteria)]MBE9197994.1 S8 family serine peptidase [Nodularia sp. LEGE 06071]MCC2691700.1 S8 family serine peptidase [Nodularia sp. LEGE 04288]
MPLDDINHNLFLHNGLNSNAISSLDTFPTQNDYSLSLSGRSSFNSANEITATSVRTANYNFSSGYGLINAAAAVARAAGQNTFGNVPRLGGNNWGADLVQAPAAWAQGYTGRGIVIAVLDTGVDYNHADLKNNIWTNPGEIPGNRIDDDGNGYIDDAQGWSFADNSNNVIDVNGHGSHVAGSIAGGNNGFGVTGIAYDAKIMPVKVLNDEGAGSTNSVADGIYYAVNNGANVINLSLGGNFPNSTLEAAIQYASSKGAVVVMAAGNNGYPFTNYPARYANNWGLAVGAVDSNNKMANFSNQAGMNAFPYVTAPGVGIYSSVPGNQYATYSGTSMATPHVAGVVALMLGANPSLTDAQIRQIIIETSGNSTPAATSNSFNISSGISQPIAEMVGNSTSATTINFELQVTILTDGHTAVSNLPPTSSFVSRGSSMNLGNLTWYDDRTLNPMSSINGDDDDQNNDDMTDIAKILNQLQQQLEEFRRFFPGF